MKPREFVILPKHLITGLLIFIALAALGYAFVPQTISRLTAPQPAEVVAREGARVFLSTDSEKGQAAWEESVCKVASEQSCVVLKKSLSPMLWPTVAKSQLRQACQSTAARLDKDIPAAADTLHFQAWSVTLECKDLKTDKAKTGDLQVLVSETPDGWKFERAMFTQENGNAAP